MDPKTTALVLIEFQNDFTSDGGSLHGAVAEVMDATDTVGLPTLTDIMAELDHRADQGLTGQAGGRAGTAFRFRSRVVFRSPCKDIACPATA